MSSFEGWEAQEKSCRAVLVKPHPNMEGRRCGRGVAAVTVESQGWGMPGEPHRVSASCLLPHEPSATPLPRQQHYSIHRGEHGLWWPSNTSWSHCISQSKGRRAGASFFTDSYCEKREWGVMGALVQVEHRVCKAIFLDHWLRSLRTYKVCLKLFARCPMKTHLHVDSLGFQSQKRLCLRPQGRFTYVQATYFSETWCHFCQTEWVKIQVSICWRVEEERILTKHKDVNFWEETRIKYSLF